MLQQPREFRPGSTDGFSDALTREFRKFTRELLGSDYIAVTRYGDRTTVSLNIDKVLARVPHRFLPRGTGIYKVLMLIDDGDPGTPDWDYPRFSP